MFTNIILIVFGVIIIVPGFWLGLYENVPSKKGFASLIITFVGIFLIMAGLDPIVGSFMSNLK